MAYKYLDNIGLAYFWTKIKAWIESAASNLMHRTGDETIEGIKAFQNSYHDSTQPGQENYTSSSLIIRIPDYDKGTDAVTNHHGNIVILDKDGTNQNWNGRLGIFEHVVYGGTTRANQTRITNYRNTVVNGEETREYTTLGLGYDDDGNSYAIAPSTSALRNNGTDIVTRNWIPNDNRIVHTIGNETIDGVKTFSSAIQGDISGTAGSVAWADVTGKPSSFPPSSHTHGNIANDGTLATANAVVVTDGSKKILASTSVTTTELGYLDGVTSSIQTQLNSKAADSGVVHTTGNETVDGNKTFGNVITFADKTGTASINALYGKVGTNDYFRIQAGGTAANAGYLEIATADDGTEPIYVRQYSGVFNTISKELVLLDGNGDTHFPKNVRLKNKDITKGTPPASNTWWNLQFTDVNDAEMGSLQYGYLSNGQSYMRVGTVKSDTTNFAGLYVGFDSNGVAYASVPSTKSTRSEGTDVVTRDWIPQDTRIVHTTGAETVSGIKTFNDRIEINTPHLDTIHFNYTNALVIPSTFPTGTVYRGYSVRDGAGRTLVDCYHRVSSTDHAKVWQMHNLSATDATQQFAFTYNNSTNKFYLSGPAQFDADDDSVKIPNTAWIRDATGDFACNAATATKLKTARTINGVAFDGSANITVADSTKLPLSGGTMTGNITFEETATLSGVSTTHNANITMNNSSLNFGAWDGTHNKWVWYITPYGNASFEGNAKTADKLSTARTIRTNLASADAVSFDGSANVAPGVTGTLPVANGGTGLTSLDTFVRTTGNQTIGGSKTFTALPIIDRTGSTLAAGALAHVLVCKYKNTAGNVDFTTYPISVIGNDNTNATNIGVRLGSNNGTTIVTAGESGGTFASVVGKYNDENLYLTADYEIQMYVKCANDSTSYAGPIVFSGTATSGGTNSTTTITATNFNGNASTATTLSSTLAVDKGGTGATTLDGAGIVTKTGNQTIGGAKTFTDSIIVSRINPYLVTQETDAIKGSTGCYNGLLMKDKNEADLGRVLVQADDNNSNALVLTCYKNIANSSDAIQVELLAYADNYYFMPRGSNGTINLGGGSNRWKQVYAANATISTSDEREKRDISPIPDEVLDAWASVEFAQFRFNDAFAEKGDNARMHSGLVAQRIERAFASFGLDASKYGLFCYDEWEAEEPQYDEKGELKRPERKAGSQYALRYEEALCMEAACMRRENARLKKRVADLEERLAALELKIS